MSKKGVVPQDADYNLKSLKMPTAGPTMLRIMVAMKSVPIIGRIMINKIRNDGGIDRLGTMTLTEVPTFSPLLPTPKVDEDEAHLSKDFIAVASELPGFRFPCMQNYTDGYRSGRFTPVDVANNLIANHSQCHQSMKIFTSFNKEDVLSQARESAERWKAGNPRGDFDGVPVTIKDCIDQIGYPTTSGTCIYDTVPTFESTVATRLRTAGAILVGKANLHEIGVGVTGTNVAWGTTRNPYNPSFHTGGSSSGCAAAAACGLVPIAVGTDGGGSIRIPSALCGVVGLKPTFGRVSLAGVVGLGGSVDHVGPIASTVADCARLYALLGGEDVADRFTLGQPRVVLPTTLDPAGRLDGMRIGVYRPWFRHATPEVVECCDRLLQGLVQRGASLHDVVIPDLDGMRIAHLVTIGAEIAESSLAGWRHHKRRFGLDTQLNIMLGQSLTAQEYLLSARLRTRAMDAFQSALEHVHVIATPTTGQPAPRVDEAALPQGSSDLNCLTEITRFAFASNLTGHPAISFPAGYTRADGLPIGIQMIGRAWGERELLRLAAVAEGLVARQAPSRYWPSLPGAAQRATAGEPI